MKEEKRCRKNSSLFSKGEMNRIIDALVHPLFDQNKAFVLADGVLHGLVEQDPPSSIRKFAKYSFPELIKPRVSPQVKLRGSKRHYSCTLPVNHRYTICNRKKAGYSCLKTGVWRCKCPGLVISYR
jgi:hypothetical protein